MYTTIVPALSTSGAAVATPSGDDLVCESFDAKIRDPIKPSSPGGDVTLAATDQTVKVLHQDTETPMVADENLLIGRADDGYWYVIVWICANG